MDPGIEWVNPDDAVEPGIRKELDVRGMDTVADQSHLWTFRHGRAVRFEWFTDPQRALQELPDTSAGTPRG